MAGQRLLEPRQHLRFVILLVVDRQSLVKPGGRIPAAVDDLVKDQVRQFVRHISYKRGIVQPLHHDRGHLQRWKGDTTDPFIRVWRERTVKVAIGFVDPQIDGLLESTAECGADAGNAGAGLAEDSLPEIQRAIIPVDLEESLLQMLPAKTSIGCDKLLLRLEIAVADGVGKMPEVGDDGTGRNEVVPGRAFLPLQTECMSRRINWKTMRLRPAVAAQVHHNVG